jgi:hypothetical protein
MKKNLLSQNSCSVISAEDSSNVLKKFLSAEQTNSLWVIFSSTISSYNFSKSNKLIKGTFSRKKFFEIIPLNHRLGPN